MEDLHEPLLAKPIFAVENGIVVAPEEGMGRLADNGIGLFRRQGIDECFRRDFRCSQEWQQDVGADGG